METQTTLKSGFAVLVGRTNVGKSTLLNTLVGTKIAIVTPRPQTTRESFHGIVHHPKGQIVFVDTPGLFKTAPSKLVQNLHHKVRDALEDIDVLIHVVDPSRPIGPEDNRVSDLVAASKKPKILVLNKLDLRNRPLTNEWMSHGKDYTSVIEVSALKNKNIDQLIEAILAHLPDGPEYYPDGQVTNVSNETWIAEIIREKIYLQTSQEVPYTATVEIEEIADRKNNLLYVKAAVLTTDTRHQKMLIGSNAKKIKEIGSAARRELEVAMNRKVFLDLDVRVDNNWIGRMRG